MKYYTKAFKILFSEIFLFFAAVCIKSGDLSNIPPQVVNYGEMYLRSGDSMLPKKNCLVTQIFIKSFLLLIPYVFHKNINWIIRAENHKQYYIDFTVLYSMY